MIAVSSVSVIVAPGASSSGTTAPTPQASAEPPNAQFAPTPIAVSAPQRLLVTPELLIEFDEAAKRFVQTLVDATNHSVLRRYPAESQLAFSRGVNAYMAAVASA